MTEKISDVMASGVGTGGGHLRGMHAFGVCCACRSGGEGYGTLGQRRAKSAEADECQSGGTQSDAGESHLKC
jgi:hypothetical protein